MNPESLEGSPVVLYNIVNRDTTADNQPEAFAGAQAAALAINKDGGIDGHPVEVKSCNQQDDTNTAASCAREAVSSEAAAVVGYCSNMGDVILPVLEEGGVPLVGNTPLTEQDFTNPMSFPIQTGTANDLAGVAVEFANRGFTKVGVVILDIPIGKPLVKHILSVASKAKTPSGESLSTFTVPVPATAADYTPYVAELEKQGAQGVVLATSPQGGGAIMTAARRLGSEMVFGSTAMSYRTQNILKSMGAEADGFVSVASLPEPTIGDDVPAIQKFQDDMAAAAEAGVENADGDYLNVASLNSWLSVYAVAEAAKGITGEITSQSLTSALGEAKDVNLQDVGFTWSPSDTGVAASPRVSNYKVFATTYDGGEFSLEGTEPIDLRPLL